MQEFEKGNIPLPLTCVTLTLSWDLSKVGPRIKVRQENKALTPDLLTNVGPGIGKKWEKEIHGAQVATKIANDVILG